MKPMVVLVISSILCRSEPEVKRLGIKDPTRVKIVSKLDIKKYLSLFNGDVRLATKEKIKDNKGCSKFIIDEIETEIQQGNKRICRRPGLSKVMSCTSKSKDFTWKIVKHEGTRVISFRTDGQGGGCLTDDGPDPADSVGNSLSVRECDVDSDAQKFWIKVVKNRVDPKV